MSSNSAVTSQIVAGSDTDFMTVTHLTASGSQFEIGRAHAERARRIYNWAPVRADPIKARARRTWFARHWPQHLARMRGAADFLGIDLQADEVYLDGLTGIPNGSACSASYYPPNAMVEGRAALGRNYDFFTTSETGLYTLMAGQQPAGEDEPPMASRPHVLTSVPDDGPATTLITMSELDCCMEGVNEHGLAVAMLMSDAENVTDAPNPSPQVGLSTSQVPRFLLDSCATVADAHEALLCAKQYDEGVPVHYLIGDRFGDALVWERGWGGDEHAVRGDGGALCVTNHFLHRHRDPAELPVDNPETLQSYERYRRLVERSSGAGLSADRLRDALDAVGFDATANVPWPIRTLWRTVFNLDQATMTTRFYLGDNPDSTSRYSPELEFAARR